MTASQLGWLIRTDEDALRADEPMDTSRTWLMLDGLCHMVDESPCYRVNWCADPNFPAARSPIVFEFPVTIAHPGSWPNFDVRVACNNFAAVSGFVEIPLRASLIIPGTSLSVRGLTNGVLGTVEVIAPSAGWAIDELFTNIDTGRCPIQPTPVPTYSGSPEPAGYSASVQLVIEWIAAGSEGFGAYILAAQVREYPA